MHQFSHGFQGAQGPDWVCVSIVEDDHVPWLVIRDHGAGMTAEIITKYFLRIGASFRRSHLWRKAFEDYTGNSLVLRSGRFGVGILSAFLLGSEMWIKTRHYSAPEDRGIEFKASLHAENIEFNRVRCDRGTENLPDEESTRVVPWVCEDRGKGFVAAVPCLSVRFPWNGIL